MGLQPRGWGVDPSGMPAPRPTLRGARGWTAAATLGALLTGLVVVQLPVANADGPSATPARSTPAVPVVLVDDPTAPRPVGWPRPAPIVEAPVVEAPLVEAPAVVRAAVLPAAPEPDPCSGDGWQQRRGQRALTSLRAGAERTGFSVRFAPGKSGYLGLTHLQERRIDVYVRDCGAQSDELLRHVVAHELGHAYDTTHLGSAQRAAWQAARGIPASTDWYGCSGCTDFATPAGDFAEVYAQWARGVDSNRSELAGDVPAGELEALAAEFFGA